MTAKRKLTLTAGVLGVGAVVGTSLLTGAGASSHREAPLISEDPVADNTDTYAFMNQTGSHLVLAGNWIPLEEPAGGPNFHRFGDDALYTFNVDNDGDNVDDVVYEFRFKTVTKNPATFLYNTGPIAPVFDARGKAKDFKNLNVQQTYSVTEVNGGVRRVLAQNLLVAPADIGPRSTKNYAGIADSVTYKIPGTGISVFAGPRDDPFFVDLGAVFDLAGLRPLNPAHTVPLPAEPGKDEVQGYNVHSIVLEVPRERVVKQDPVVGVYSATYRRQTRVLDAQGGKPTSSGGWVQVSRLGMPLVNEVVIPLGKKDRFNASDPAGDGQFLDHVVDPELGTLIPALYPVFECFPEAPRDDLVTIFLTGIPGLNQPENVKGSEMIRINTATKPTALSRQNRLGLLSGQADGFPNGRRLVDDVTDIELQAIAGATPLGDCNGKSPNNALTDGVDANDKAFMATFPYLALPAQGYAHQD